MKGFGFIIASSLGVLFMLAGLYCWYFHGAIFVGYLPSCRVHA